MKSIDKFRDGMVSPWHRAHDWWKKHVDESTKRANKRRELRTLVGSLVDHHEYEAQQPAGEVFWGDGDVNADIVFVTLHPGAIEPLMEGGDLREAWQNVCREMGVPCTKQDAYFTSILKHDEMSHDGLAQKPIWSLITQSFNNEIALLAPKVVVILGDPLYFTWFAGASMSVTAGTVVFDRVGTQHIAFILSHHPAILLGEERQGRSNAAFIEAPLREANFLLNTGGTL